MKNQIVIFLTVGICTGCATLESKQRAAYQGHLSKGQRYLTATKYERAAREFTSALEIPGQPDRGALAGILLAETHLKQGQIDTAAELAADLTANHPAQSGAWELSGKIHLKQGRWTQAEADITKALELAEAAEQMRLQSLLALVRGSKAYAHGCITEARQHWSAVSDPVLRRAMLAKTDDILEININPEQEEIR